MSETQTAVSAPSPLSILLVEDNPTDARLVRELLTKANIRPGDAVTGKPPTFAHVVRLQEAVDCLEARAIDVIILDLSLPDAQGLQAVTRLHAIAPTVPIVVMSAQRDEALALAGVQAGAQDYLIKGQVEGDALARAMRYAIARTHDEQERLRRAEALPVGEQGFRTLIEAVPIGACIVDEHGVFEAVNDAFAALYGYTRAELLGQHVDRFAALSAEAIALAQFAPLAVSGEVDQHEYIAVTKRGQQLTLLVRTVQFAGADGRPRHASFALDVTARVQALREAERARAAAEDLDWMRSDFLAAVSHELRTPLTAIIGFAEVLQARWTRMGDDQRLERVGKIMDSANRQRRLVEDLLLLSGMEAGGLQVGSEVASPALLAQQAADEVRATYRDLRVDLAGPSGVEARADAERMLQVLVILIDNAAKSSPEGSPVAVSWQADGGALSIRVRDSGPGISEQGRVHLFMRFGRTPSSPIREGRMGTGIGLYLGRQLAQAMGGSLELEATGDEGSTFCLRLPLAHQTLDPE